MKFNRVILLFTIFILSCDKDETITSNILDIITDYQLDLSCDNCGKNKYTVDISWESYLFSEFGTYSISYNDNEIIISDSSESSYTISLEPGEFINVNFSVFDDNSEVLFYNSIQIFTRIIYPVMWSKIEVDNDFNHILEWDISDEPVSEFLAYKIFRSNESSIEDDCSNCIEIVTIDENTINQYIDTTTTQVGHTFMIATLDTSGHYQLSTLDNSIVFFEAPNSEDITGFIASNEFEDYIKLEWDKPQITTEFYSIEIWRDSDQWINFHPSLNTKLATIINLNDFVDFNKIYFEDRYNIGSGTTWYYRLKITNIYGMFEQSNVVEGITKL